MTLGEAKKAIQNLREARRALAGAVLHLRNQMDICDREDDSCRLANVSEDNASRIEPLIAQIDDRISILENAYGFNHNEERTSR